MVEGKKYLPGEAENETFPIDVEDRLTNLGLYEEKERAENNIEIMRCIYRILNAAYSRGKRGEPLDPDMVARFQGVAAIPDGGEIAAAISQMLILLLYNAYAQGCKDRGNEARHGKTD